MEWYALQVMSGAEADVAQNIQQFGFDTILPVVPVFLKHGSRNGLPCKLTLVKRPMIPGYLFVKADLLELYKIQQIERLKLQQKKIIRICGNGACPVPLDNDEISFFRMCQESMWPLRLWGGSNSYTVFDPPPWMHEGYIRWYDSDKFKANVIVFTGALLQKRSFNIAAYHKRYSGGYKGQLQELSELCHGQFETEDGKIRIK